MNEIIESQKKENPLDVETEEEEVSSTLGRTCVVCYLESYIWKASGIKAPWMWIKLLPNWQAGSS
jgi:SUMO ligase MMS21 Smc5/6 complex component